MLRQKEMDGQGSWMEVFSLCHRGSTSWWCSPATCKLFLAISCYLLRAFFIISTLLVAQIGTWQNMACKISLDNFIIQIPSTSIELCLIYCTVVSPQMVEHGSLKL